MAVKAKVIRSNSQWNGMEYLGIWDRDLDGFGPYGGSVWAGLRFFRERQPLSSPDKEFDYHTIHPVGTSSKSRFYWIKSFEILEFLNEDN